MEFKVGVFADVVDHIIYGTVIQEVKTSNIAREVSLTQSKSPSLTGFIRKDLPTLFHYCGSTLANFCKGLGAYPSVEAYRYSGRLYFTDLSAALIRGVTYQVRIRFLKYCFAPDHNI